MKTKTKKQYTRLNFDIQKFLIDKRHSITTLAKEVGITHPTFILARATGSITVSTYKKIKERFIDIDNYIL